MDSGRRFAGRGTPGAEVQGFTKGASGGHRYARRNFFDGAVEDLVAAHHAKEIGL